MSKDFPDWTAPATYYAEQVFLGILTSGQSSGELDTSRYSSLDVMMLPSNGGVNQRTITRAYQVTGGGNTINDYLTLPPSGAIQGQWRLPVVSNFMKFDAFPAAGNQTIQIFGSNREIDTLQQYGVVHIPRSFAGSPAGAGTFVLISADGEENVTRFNGLTSARFASSGPNASYGYQYVDTGGTLRNVVLGIGVGAASVFTSFLHPGSPVQWFVTVAGAGNVTIDLNGVG